MDARLLEAVKILFFQLLGGNQDPMRAGLAVVVGLLACSIVVSWVGSMMGGNGVLYRSALLVTILDVVLLLGVAAVAREYICPLIDFIPHVWITPGVVVLAFFLIILPLTAKVLSVNYLVSLVTLTCSTVALILFVYLAVLGYDTFRRGAGDIKSQRSMKRAEDNAISF